MSRDLSTPELAALVAAITLVPGVFGAFCPPLSKVRHEADESGDTAHAIGTAALVSAVTVAALAVIVQSARVAVVGGIGVAAYAGAYAVARNVPAWPPQ